MIHAATLFSGSSGNSTLLYTEKTAVLIDAGRSCKAVCTSLAALGKTLSDIDAVFVTHEHSDHISALDVMLRKRRIPVHVTAASAAELCKVPAAAACAVIHDTPYFSEAVGDMVIDAFPLPHDSRCHVGYVAVDADGDRAGVATDMGRITPEARSALSGCRQVVTEANHDVEMLRCGRYPYALKKRILSGTGHLSNDDCAVWCRLLAEGGTRAIMLAHLSLDNNDPGMAFAAVRRELDSAGFSDVVLKVAPRFEPLEL